jgi:hypothetical protein
MLLYCDFTVFTSWINMKYKNIGEKETDDTNGIISGYKL